jgi:hypothetical protein
MDILTALFGNEAKVRLIRLFLFSVNTPLFTKEIVAKVRANKAVVNRELRILEKGDLIRKKSFSKDVEVKKGKKVVIKKMKGTGYVLNEKFSFLVPLRNLLTVASIQADDSLSKRFNATGKLKLLIASGVFIQNWDSRVDLLIVGDDLNKGKVDGIMKSIEADIGKEISYSAFETEEFRYRYDIHDRLVRDILDFPHVVLINRSILPE